LSHNGASDAQASVYLWVGVAIGIYVRAQVCKPGYCLYCLIVNTSDILTRTHSHIPPDLYNSKFILYKRTRHIVTVRQLY